MFSLQEYFRNPKTQAEIGLRKLSDGEIKKVQKTLLIIYQDVMYVCEKHHLQIMLAGGSALGAVRHSGFIPWDDDMDMIMPRWDFDRFVNLFIKEFGDKYHILSPVSKEGNIDFFISIIDKNSIFINMFDILKKHHCGIRFEITPIDYVVNSRVLRSIKGFASDLFLFIVRSRMICKFRNKYSDRLFMMSFKSMIVYCSRLLIGFCSCLFPYEKLMLAYDSFVKSKKETNMMTIACGRNHYFGEMHEKNVFFPVREICFENIKSYIPNNCDAYLRRLYGDDYMQIPPVEKREPHPCVKLEFRDTIS
ncbi:LicD family protein [Parabacteroides sp.]|uniref:LicD family protein n=1 Tax=Parabacteroides sp. TaxID=1869337 RepID=UPI00257B2257|nr:LicD family protein [Parabacteroides sp.]